MYLPLRIPVWAGNLISLALLGLGGLLLLTAKTGTLFGLNLLAFQTPLLNFAIAAALLLGGGLLLWVFSHSIAHWFAGRLLGVRFTHYFVGTTPVARLLPLPDLLQELLVVPGIAIDAESKRRVSPRRMAAMYAAGPVVSTLFVVAAAGFAATVAIPAFHLFGLPLHTLLKGSILLVALAIVASLFVTSPRVGCISKALRALAKGRAASG